MKFWSFPDGPHEPTLHQNPVKCFFYLKNEQSLYNITSHSCYFLDICCMERSLFWEKGESEICGILLTLLWAPRVQSFTTPHPRQPVPEQGVQEVTSLEEIVSYDSNWYVHVLDYCTKHKLWYINILIPNFHVHAYLVDLELCVSVKGDIKQLVSIYLFRLTLWTVYTATGYSISILWCTCLCQTLFHE